MTSEEFQKNVKKLTEEKATPHSATKLAEILVGLLNPEQTDELLKQLLGARQEKDENETKTACDSQEELGNGDKTTFSTNPIEQLKSQPNMMKRLDETLEHFRSLNFGYVDIGFMTFLMNMLEDKNYLYLYGESLDGMDFVMKKSAEVEIEDFAKVVMEYSDDIQSLVDFAFEEAERVGL